MRSEIYEGAEDDASVETRELRDREWISVFSDGLRVDFFGNCDGVTKLKEPKYKRSDGERLYWRHRHYHMKAT